MVAPHIKVLHTFAELRELLAGHRMDAAGPLHDADVFCSLPWLENLAAHGLAASGPHRGAPLLLAGALAEGHIVCLPLLDGNTLTALSNYYSSLYGPLVWRLAGAPYAQPLPEAMEQWLQVVCHQLRAQRKWPVISLSPMDWQSPFFSQILAALRQSGYWVDSFFCFGNWYLDVAGRSFEVYFSGLPSPLRHAIERGQRRLTREGPWQIVVQQRADAALESSIADFVNVYNQSWKNPEPDPGFIPAMARMAAAQGWLRLGVLKLAGQTVAAQLWLVKDGKANIYKLAYVQGYERFSVGSVLTKALMEHAMDIDKVSEVDYLTGDDPYKRDWMSARRERWGVVAFEPTMVAGAWQALKHLTARKIKKWGA